MATSRTTAGTGAKGDPEEVRVHDFLIKELGRAVPYGVYDLAANTGWVSVGIDHDTSAFAVQRSAAGGRKLGASATQTQHGSLSPPMAAAATARACVYGNANCSGSPTNSASRSKSPFAAWHQQWNKIASRLSGLFVHQPELGAGKHLVSYRVIVDLIAATTTGTGLKVLCELRDENCYPKGIAVSDAEIKLTHSTSNAQLSTENGITQSRQLTNRWRRYFLTVP